MSSVSRATRSQPRQDHDGGGQQQGPVGAAEEAPHVQTGGAGVVAVDHQHLADEQGNGGADEHSDGAVVQGDEVAQDDAEQGGVKEDDGPPLVDVEGLEDGEAVF